MSPVPPQYIITADTIFNVCWIDSNYLKNYGIVLVWCYTHDASYIRRERILGTPITFFSVPYVLFLFFICEYQYECKIGYPRQPLSRLNLTAPLLPRPHPPPGKKRKYQIKFKKAFVCPPPECILTADTICTMHYVLCWINSNYLKDCGCYTHDATEIRRESIIGTHSTCARSHNIFFSTVDCGCQKKTQVEQKKQLVSCQK